MPVYRVPVKLSGWSGGPGVNVWHVRTLGAPSVDLPAFTTQLNGALTSLRTFYESTSPIWAQVTAAISGDIVDVETGEEPNIVGLGWSLPLGINPPLPLAAHVCVNWTTSLRARRGRGRTFLGPLNDGQSDAQGTPSIACLDTVRAAAATLVNDSEADTGWAVGVYGLESEWPSWGAGPPPESTPRVLRDITGTATSDKFAVLRSRRD